LVYLPEGSIAGSVDDLTEGAVRKTQVRSLLERELTPVYRFALRLTGDRHVAEDLTQDAMLRAWKARRRMPKEGELRPWMFRITRNLWIDETRRREVRSRHEGNLGAAAAAREPEQTLNALGMLDRLPARQREVLYLAACEGLTPTQIGRVLDITPEAAKASASVARAKLRELSTCEEGAYG
jgi:RNA polymerase sigma-70 factor (ECF subfamily)